jgi:hypothetical protein
MRYQKVAERREIRAGDRRSQDPAGSGGQASGTRLRNPGFLRASTKCLVGKGWHELALAE